MGPTPHTEAGLKALMLLGLDGDAEAYRTVLSELANHLRTYYHRRLASDRDVGEDLVQETLLAIHLRRSSFDRTQPFTAWAYAIARYKLIDHLRRSRSRPYVPIEDCVDLFAPDETRQAETSRDVERLLSALPPGTSRAIRETRIEGHSLADTAARAGKSVTAMKVCIHRGLRRLAALSIGQLDADS